MAKTELQKKTGLDLLIILIATFLVLGIYMGLQSQFKTYINTKSMHILLRVAAAAFLQFGVAGLGISIACIMRKESFRSHGLLPKGALLSIVYSVLAFVPNILLNLANGRMKSYLPFQTVWVTREVLASGFPVNVLGMGLIAAAWGFFEGFNYVVICNKLNILLPSSKKWLNWGVFGTMKTEQSGT